MHRALHIAEIISMVLDRCDTRSRGRLTSVCRQIHPLAVARLWKSLRNLNFLLDTLPRDFVDQTSDPDLGSKYLKPVLRPLGPHEWSSFTKYAKYTQTLCVCPEAFSAEVYQTLSLGKPALYLLPNLTALELNFYHSAIEDGCLMGSTLLFSPNLKSITIYMYITDEDLGLPFGVFLATLVHHSPRLTHFSIDAPLSTQIAATQFVDSLLELEVLRSIKIKSTSADPFPFEPTLYRLATLPFLEELEIFPNSFEDGPSRDLEGSSPFFPALRHFGLYSLALLPRILRKMEQIPLESLVIEVREYWDKEAMSGVLPVLEACYALTLRRLIIHSPSKIPSEWFPSSLIDNNVLQPLLSMKLLVELHLNQHGILAITDSFLEQASHSWPNITILMLNSEYPPKDNPNGIRPSVTLHGVNTLLARCSKLRTLGLCFDDTITARNRLKRKREDLAVSTSLRSWEVGHSRIKYPGRTAAWLSIMLPRSTRLTCRGEYVDYHQHAMFDQMKALIPVFREVRLEERENATRKLEG